MLKNVLFLVFLSLSILCQAQDYKDLSEKKIMEGITVDLREPLYSDGILTTEKGGVITGPDIRIQAQKIRYVQHTTQNEVVATIEAEDQLIVEFGSYIFVGKKLFYDFQKQEGKIEQGRTTIEPWFFGGEEIELRSNKTYVIHHGFITTSESICHAWQLLAEEIQLCPNRSFLARRLHFQLGRFTFLTIPYIRANLNSIFDHPIRYRFRFGGKQGPRFGLTYEIFSNSLIKTFLRFDYRFTRGPGGGFEFYYQSLDRHTEFQSINYVTRDTSIFSSKGKTRYRFEGVLKKKWNDEKCSLLFTYDKLSDFDMPGSYDEDDFDYETSMRTQLLLRRQEENWISHFYTRVRLNPFQTVKQELPSYSIHFRPIHLGHSGVIFEQFGQFSYLNFKYANYLDHVHNYQSTRLEYRPSFYRPFPIGPFTFTPEIGSILILYGNSPKKDAQLLGLGYTENTLRTHLYRFYGPFKHVIEPYAIYRYYMHPSVSPNHHYIFDIDDGWTHLNQLTFGIRNALYTKRQNGCLWRIFFTDLYAHAFFNARGFIQTIPKIYSRSTFFFVPTLRHTLEIAWDFEHGLIDHFNFQTAWTISDNLAFSAEFRHRSPYSWRKVDQDQFFLEMFRSQKSLFCSPLSDQRDTVLFHLFYRFNPNWALEMESRHGWNRRHEPFYNEFEVALLTTVQTAWHLKLSFQHKEHDNRIGLYLNIGLKRPNPNLKRRSICYDD